MGLEVDFIRLQNSLISKLCNMHLEIENKKRSFRSLWISRINAGSRKLRNLLLCPYAFDLKKKEILLNRKILSEIAVNDSPTFEKVVKTAVN